MIANRDVIFEISEGSTVEIERINFVGNRSFSDGRLRRVLESKQAGLLRKLILRDTLINERISLDKRLLTDFYRSRGFADFEIYDVNAELSEEKDAFFISYNIKEGPRFEIGAVENVLNGHIDPFVESYLRWVRSESNEIYLFKTLAIANCQSSSSWAVIQQGDSKVLIFH